MSISINLFSKSQNLSTSAMINNGSILKSVNNLLDEKVANLIKFSELSVLNRKNMIWRSKSQCRDIKD